jgi:hypothetical protein
MPDLRLKITTELQRRIKTCSGYDQQGVQEWAIHALETHVAQHPLASLLTQMPHDTQPPHKPIKDKIRTDVIPNLETQT